jgi:hypothetical protein
LIDSIASICEQLASDIPAISQELVSQRNCD